MPKPDNPTISRVRALITTPWGNQGYRPVTVKALESYFIDTALDNDSDSWTMDISDPHGVYLDLFERDGEIRNQIFGIGRQGAQYISTGIVDEASYSEQGTITLAGRDYSSLAVDSTVPPQQFRKQRSYRIVAKQAKEIGFPDVSLLQTGKMHNVLFTDGSESYWEFWYRLFRKDKMFLWCEANGTLIGRGLNYNNPPVYFLGWPHQGDSAHIAEQYIPIERLEIHKTTQKRLGEVWVFGSRGEVGFREVVRDPTTKQWLKRPRKIMLDSASHSPKGARKIGREEIFEGKVGSLEYKVTVADPGFAMRQNQIARLNVPEIGLFGEFFVVGSRIQCGADGFLQEIRLREKQYAISRRVPDDPKKTTKQAPQRTSVLTSLAGGIAGVANMPETWGQFFVTAAKEFHGPWDFNLFLATLIGICDQETSFRNVREQGSVWWYEPPNINAAGDAHRHGDEPPVRTLDEWKLLFSNDAGASGNPVNGRSSNAEAGVGPMQLTTRTLKYYADDHFKLNRRDQYIGGRWHPEHNIWGAAKYLREILRGLGDGGQDNLMWSAVSAYNVGHVEISPGTAGYKYMYAVKQSVLHSPGYLASVTTAVDAARQASKDATDDPVLPSGTPGLSPNKKFVMPLAYPVSFNSSEFLVPDAEGAPDRFGRRYHAAKDWFAPAGTHVFSPSVGRIVEIQKADGDYSGQVFGGVVKVQMPNGNVWVFRHVDPADLKVQQRVNAGALIASVARWNDNPSSTHTHIEYWLKLSGGYNLENMRDPCKVLTE
jgi:prophage tail gpP-like protein